MGFLAKLLRPTAMDPGFDDRWYATVVGEGYSSAGAYVSAASAMRVSAVWACVRLISQSLASTPLLVYRYLANGGRERATQHPLYDVLHRQPNAQQTQVEFVEMMTGHALLRGNAYARIVPGPRGFADQLVPIHPDLVTVEPLGDSKVRYQVQQGDGGAKTYNDEDILHLKGLSDDGVKGLSVLEYARETFGLAIAAEGYGARFFSNDARPGGIIKHPNKLTPDAAKRLRDSWEAAHAGFGKSHGTAVLEEGSEWQQIGMTSEDSQFIETREFQIADIARWFGCPLHLIQETSKATSWGSGIESLGIAFVTYTLLPWARRWEQAVSRDLILAPNTYFCEFLFDGLVRGDLKSRYDAYAVGRQWGWLSVNDIRQKENMNPVDGGDGYLQAMNMTELGAPPAQEPAPSPPPPRDDRAEAHYRLLLNEAAGRVVHKEVVAMGKAAKRCPSDTVAWVAAIDEFYEEHRAFVLGTMHLSAQNTELYVDAQRDALLAHGAAIMVDWETRRVADLVALALGGAQ